MIYELNRYCHSHPVDQDMLISKLQMLQANFKKVPEIAGERIMPLILYEMDQLTSIENKATLTPGILNLCDKLVEYLHIEVMGSEGKSVPVHPVHEEPPKVEIPKKEPVMNVGQINCQVCGNVITGSNKSLICMKCKSKFCSTCEEWFREERNRGEKPLCEKCFVEEQERLRRQREEESQVLKEKEEQERLLREEEERKEREKKEREEQKRQQREEEELKKQESTPKTYTNSIGMEFTLIPAGEFMMGSEEYKDEKPGNRVKISKPFYLGTYPLTQKEWESVMGNNPSRFKGDNLPVEQVSWDDVQVFIEKLNQKEGGNKYRLPSEAEWEYAARAGTTMRFSFGDDGSKLGDYAWYCENSGSRPPKKGDYFGYDKDDWFGNKWNGKTHEVGTKEYNPWGLYDMHGNVWEWVQDKWHGDYSGAPADGRSWESGDGSCRVIRGGSWGCGAMRCQSANRNGYAPGSRYYSLGFRLLRIL
jgi:formylglycine-generating enzyme required for sulfatase activity